jgi:hypothetical protein
MSEQYCNTVDPEDYVKDGIVYPPPAKRENITLASISKGYRKSKKSSDKIEIEAISKQKNQLVLRRGQVVRPQKALNKLTISHNTHKVSLVLDFTRSTGKIEVEI